MRTNRFIVAVASSVLLFSCVSSKKFKESEAKYVQLSGAYLEMQGKYRELQDQIKDLENQLAKSKGQNNELNARKQALEDQIADLNKQIDFLKQNNTTVLNQLKDLSVVTGAQAESIKKSLENIGAKDLYIRDLQGSIV